MESVHHALRCLVTLKALLEFDSDYVPLSSILEKMSAFCVSRRGGIIHHDFLTMFEQVRELLAQRIPSFRQGIVKETASATMKLWNIWIGCDSTHISIDSIVCIL